MKLKHQYIVLILAVLTLGTLAAGQSSEVPFDFIHNEIVVRVMINGKGPFNAMIDTGTDPSAIDIATARGIGIELGKKAHKSAGGGTDVNLTYACKLPGVVMGDIKATNIEAGAINLSKVSERMGVNIDAILGYSFLKKRIVQFDYPRSVVRFLDRPLDPGRAKNAVTLPFRFKHDVLIDGILVNGKPVTANLDTGSSGSIEFSPAATEKLGLSEEAARGTYTTSVGYNGPFVNHIGTVKNITIGTISVDNMQVYFFSKGSGHDNVPWSINIGNEFMKDYIVTVDYISKTVTFAFNK